MGREPTVYVVDDDQAVGNSLSWLIGSINLNVEMHGSARSFLEACEPAHSGCLVLDVRMPGMSGLDLQEELVNHGITLPVIIITGHADVPMAIRAMKAGAFDFVEKPFNDQVLLERIQEAIKCDADARQHAAQWLAIDSRIATLTRREREVMDCVVAGKSNRQIADELGVSMKTVEAHRANMMLKMSADSLSNLVEKVVLWRENRKRD
jgi:FixJ family two-component response regulator